MQLRHIVRQAQRGSQEAAQELLTQFEPLISRQIAKYRPIIINPRQKPARRRTVRLLNAFTALTCPSAPASRSRCRPAFTTRLLGKHTIRNGTKRWYKRTLSKMTAGQTCHQTMKTKQATAPIHPSFAGKPWATWTPSCKSCRLETGNTFISESKKTGHTAKSPANTAYPKAWYEKSSNKH